MDNGGFDSLLTIIMVLFTMSLIGGPIIFGLSFIKIIPNFIIYLLCLPLIGLSFVWISNLRYGFNMASFLFAIECILFCVLAIGNRFRLK